MEYKFAFAGGQDVPKNEVCCYKQQQSLYPFTVRRCAPSLVALQCPASHHRTPRAISLAAWRLPSHHQAPRAISHRSAPFAAPFSRPGAERAPLSQPGADR
eukprot:5634846-Pleurochrysis_carterae.AAC.1